MKSRKPTAEDRAQAIAHLRRHLRPGSRVYTTLRHVAASGMYRRIALLIVRRNKHVRGPYVQNISSWVAGALGLRWYDDDSVGVGGCGQDMGFHLTYELGRLLFRNGGLVSRSSRGVRGARKELNGGYLLDHRWV